MEAQSVKSGREKPYASVADNEVSVLIGFVSFLKKETQLNKGSP